MLQRSQKSLFDGKPLHQHGDGSGRHTMTVEEEMFDGKKNINQSTDTWHTLDKRHAKRYLWSGGEPGKDKKKTDQNLQALVMVLNFILWAVEAIESFLAKKRLDHIWGELGRCNKARTT